MVTEILGPPENILAVTQAHKQWAYYATPVEIWVLDWDAWHKMFVECGYGDTSSDASERGGVRVLNEDTVETAMSALAQTQVSEEQLRQALREQVPIRSWWQVVHLFPAVLADFDSRRLISMYSEPLELERWVPTGWTGKFGNVLDEIPEEHKYWIDGSLNYLEMALRAEELAGR